MAKGELWFDFFGIMPAIANKDAFFVNLIDAIAGIRHLAKSVRGIVFQFDREGKRQFAGRADVAADDISESMASFAAKEPALN